MSEIAEPLEQPEKERCPFQDWKWEAHYYPLEKGIPQIELPWMSQHPVHQRALNVPLKLDLCPTQSEAKLKLKESIVHPPNSKP